MKEKLWFIVGMVIGLVLIMVLYYALLPTVPDGLIIIEEKDYATVFLQEGADEPVQVLTVVSWNGTPTAYYTQSLYPGEYQPGNNDILPPRLECKKFEKSGKDCSLDKNDEYLIEVFSCDEVTNAGYPCIQSWPAAAISVTPHFRYNEQGELMFGMNEVDRESFKAESYPSGLEPLVSAILHFK